MEQLGLLRIVVSIQSCLFHNLTICGVRYITLCHSISIIL